MEARKADVVMGSTSKTESPPVAPGPPSALVRRASGRGRAHARGGGRASTSATTMHGIRKAQRTSDERHEDDDDDDEEYVAEEDEEDESSD